MRLTLLLLLLPSIAAAEHVIGVRATLAGGVPYIESPEIGGALNWRLEDDTGFFELDLGLHGPFTHDGDGAIWFGLGRSFYLGDYYLGGDVQLRAVYDGIDNTGCWATGIGGQGGYMFMHDQSTRVYLELRVVQNVLPFNCKDATSTTTKESTRTHWRTEVGFSVGVGF